jgi:hypothetical protein
MKKVIVVLLVLALAIGGGVWYFVSYRMDSLIETRIEAAGSASLARRRQRVCDGSISDISRQPARATRTFSLIASRRRWRHSTSRLVNTLVIEEMSGKTISSRC